MKKQYFKFSTQYRQFYIEDKDDNEKGNAGLPDFWSEEAFNSRLAMVNGVIGVGTESYGNIKGEIEVLEKPNTNIDYTKYDHVVEGGINISSGELQIKDCPNANLELSLKIDPGKYRVRIYSSNLDSVKDYDLPNDTDDDYYRIELWKSDDMERRVLKQYEYK
ncbi:hypothetical protein [Chryseobacterium oryctis]|uniref:Uncharacterized protein n=1 Tax=Chryseobacterium oryctis TaxID=2952618 RepID=A0ABT3HSU8_9FLAO|nr:hypothetical protein [Chryseobacterium oryctis]MCW3162852.1 hypothetical protein [Chryseobacterium oryctis]MCW3162858.1 hypothetical protein [Chryseobacterium oryctis]